MIGFLMLIIGMLNQWAVYPIPIAMAIKWLVFGFIQFMICGVVAALIYKPKE